MQTKQNHDYVFVSKHSPEVSDAYYDLTQLLREVHEELKDYTFQHRLVGSYEKNLITYDRKSSVGYDFDVDICPYNLAERFSAKEIKLKFKAALDKHCHKYHFDAAEDSKRVLTIKVKDKVHSRVLYSVDFAFVRECWDEDGLPFQEYIHFNKKQGSYSWSIQSSGFSALYERLDDIKAAGLWDELRNYYIEKKNSNSNPHIHSRQILAISAKEICEQY